MNTKIAQREQVILVHVIFNDRAFNEDVDEFVDLATSAGTDVISLIKVVRNTPDPKYLIGQGKVLEIQAEVNEYDASVVLFNYQLTPSQERNLVKIFKCTVIDRTGLILDIFAQRAQTHEGKLQVELAQLKHLSTRLIRGWTHLERQKGGIGLRGPGETQLETDRRLIRYRIKSINKQLHKIRQRRELSRRARKKNAIPVVALVGYTNSGKSTLFNCLTQSDVYIADQLFATLDPTVRRIDLPYGNAALLTDTVGFIRHLPHELIESFRATLEEIKEANLLLHIIDVNLEDKPEIIQQVNDVLKIIDATHVPQMMVYNKIDYKDYPINVETSSKPTKIWISAKEAKGIDRLKERIAIELFGDPVFRYIYLSPTQGKIRSELYEQGVVKYEQVTDKGFWQLGVRMSKENFDAIVKKSAKQRKEDKK